MLECNAEEGGGRSSLSSQWVTTLGNEVHRFHDIKGIAEAHWLKLRFISALNSNDSNYEISKNNFNITFSPNKLV